MVLGPSNQETAYIAIKDMSSTNLPPYDSFSRLLSPELKPAAFRLHDKKRKIDYWAWEWGALLLSFMAVATSAVVLLKFDQQPIPPWSWQSNGISVNAIISLLSTLSRASLLLPIDECMGQLMWLRYSTREQRLADFRAYNEASRGALGAAKFFWRQRGLTLGCLGSALLIGSLGIGTAQQQLLSYPSRLFVDHAINATVTRAENFDSYQNITVSGSTTPIMSFSLLSSIYSASLLSDPQKASTSTEVIPFSICSVGTCTFPVFTTLAICSECHDASDQVQSTCDNNGRCTADFEGLEAFSWEVSNATNINTILNQSSIESTSVTFTAKSPFAVMAHLQANSSNTWPPKYTGTQCALYYCAKTVNATIQNATYTEAVLATSDNYSNSSSLGGITILGPDLNDTFHVTSSAHSSIIGDNGVAATLKGWAKGNPSGAERSFSSDLLQGFSSNANISNVMDRIALSMTNRIRNSDSTTMAVPGEAWRRQSFISVRWYWLLYPVTLWTLSLIFLICVVVDSRIGEQKRGVRAWGANSLALLFYGLDDETRLRIRDGEWEQMEDLSERLWVKLEAGKGGMRLRARRIDNE